MSIELPIVSTIEAAHCNAIDEVNRWRGHCIELFARIEKTLIEALEKNGAAATPALLPRIAAVSALPGVKPKLNAKLEKLRGLAEDRNLIVHSTSTVWIDGNGGWLWAFTFTPAGKAKVSTISHWDRDRAQAFEKQLSSVEQSLRAQLNPR
jgi:hypothetical protein